MVYRGIPSTACFRCRRRKLRCSHEDPQCSQCTNAGVSCSGYRDQLEMMFCDESASVVEKANRPNAASRSHTRPEKSSALPKPRENPNTKSTKLFDIHSNFIGDVFTKFGGFGTDGNVNPFDRMAVTIKSDIKYLTQYCAMELDPILVPLGRGAHETQWLPKVHSDQMIFYFTLWKVSARFALMNPEDSALGHDVVRYYQKTVLLLNDRLQNPSYAVSDETTKVVVGLLSKAIADRNATEAGIHMAGLRTMLGNTGGQQQSRINARLQESVFWHEICYASAFSDTPIFHEPHPRPPISTLPLIVYFSPNSSMATLGSGFQILTQVSPSFGDLISLFIELRFLSIVAEFTTPGPDNHSPAALVLSQRHDAVDHNLRSLSIEGIPECDARIVNACRIAALIYTSLTLQYNHPSTVPRQWLKDLREALDKEINQTWRTLTELRCWMLFTGSICCLENEGELQEWFFEMLARTVIQLGVQDEDGLKRVLSRFLWVGSRTTRFGEFWRVSKGFI